MAQWLTRVVSGITALYEWQCYGRKRSIHGMGPAQRRGGSRGGACPGSAEVAAKRRDATVRHWQDMALRCWLRRFAASVG